MQINPEHLIFLLVLLSIGIGYANVRFGWPFLTLLNRWLRWTTFSILFAWVGQLLSQPHSEPFALLMFTGFLVYALIETMYNWVAIGALSRSELALFPAFKANDDGDEWPSHTKYMKAKEWIRMNGFKQQQSLKAMLDELFYIRSTVYESEDRKVRLQVLFIPQRGSSLAMCFVFSSMNENGERCITDNMFLPFGGFYPANWHLLRRPMSRSIKCLYKKHMNRISSISSAVPWTDEPLDDLNAQQKQLERINTKAGFLVPRNQQEEYGKISGEGRYRIWKEIWLLNYLGIPHLGKFQDENA